MITVYYDGKCGACAKEINYYRKIVPPNIFDWQDITQAPDILQAHGVSLAQGLKLLHVTDHDSKLHIGVDAFIVIWQQMRYWRILAAVVSLPGIRKLVNLAYSAFAHLRFKRLAHCQLAAKDN